MVLQVCLRGGRRSAARQHRPTEAAFHQALEDFHGDFPRPRRADEAAMRGRIRECITWAFERNREGFETPVEFELQVRRAQSHRAALRRLAARRKKKRHRSRCSAREVAARARSRRPPVRRLHRSARPRRAFRRNRRRRLQDREASPRARPSTRKKSAVFAIFSFRSITGHGRLPATA